MRPDQTALILVDIQRDFWQSLKHHPEFKDFPKNVKTLLETARKRNHTIIHVKSEFQPDRSDWMLFYRPEGRGTIPCIKGKPGTIIEEFASPKPGEKLFIKQRFDAFVDTGLREYLKSRDIKAVFISGTETSVCILFTATSAYLRQVMPLVVTDACADTPERHNATLKMYEDLSFKTVTTGQLVDDYESIEKLISQFTEMQAK